MRISTHHGGSDTKEGQGEWLMYLGIAFALALMAVAVVPVGTVAAEWLARQIQGADQTIMAQHLPK